MLEVTNGFFASTNAQNALQELFGTRFDTATTLKISRLKSTFDKYSKDVRQKYQTIMFKHAELGAQKNFIPADNIFGIKFKDQASFEAALKEADELEKIKIQLPRCEKIPVELIKEISTNDLMALMPILEGVDFSDEKPGFEAVK